MACAARGGQIAAIFSTKLGIREEPVCVEF